MDDIYHTIKINISCDTFTKTCNDVASRITEGIFSFILEIDACYVGYVYVVATDPCHPYVLVSITVIVALMSIHGEKIIRDLSVFPSVSAFLACFAECIGWCWYRCVEGESPGSYTAVESITISDRRIDDCIIRVIVCHGGACWFGGFECAHGITGTIWDYFLYARIFCESITDIVVGYLVAYSLIYRCLARTICRTCISLFRDEEIWSIDYRSARITIVLDDCVDLSSWSE